MRQECQNFIPILSSEAGLCLTVANWREVGVNTAAYYLDSLLLKPGYFLLQKIHDLKAYLGWSGSLVLNAKRFLANKEGIYTLTSPYDGSKIKLTYFEWVDMIWHLKPDTVVLPKRIVQDYPEIWTHWMDSMMPLIHADDLLQLDMQRPHGVYFNFDASDSIDTLLEQLDKWPHVQRYITGDVNWELMKRLKMMGVEHIESDAPAEAAMQGLVYTQVGEVNLLDNQTAMHFETIGADCTCPTCSQGLTQAYLHHLLLHTPLLCQRFSMQHNVCYAQIINNLMN